MLPGYFSIVKIVCLYNDCSISFFFIILYFNLAGTLQDLPDWSGKDRCNISTGKLTVEGKC